MTTSAEQRVAQIRAEAAVHGESLDHLSDLEVLNERYETREHEWIATRDRYMGLLREQRLYGDRVRAACMRDLRERIDVLATQAVQSLSGHLTTILSAVEVLPERPKAERIAALKEQASRAAFLLSRDEQRPSQVWRLDDAHTQVSHVRHVLGVLRERAEVPAADVIRLVGEAVTPNGNLRDLFTVADLSPRPAPPKPPFAGDSSWRDRVGYWAYEPHGDSARVVAFPYDETWFLDLYSPTGALLAYGQARADDVARITAALIARAPRWAITRGHAWQRFEEITA